MPKTATDPRLESTGMSRREFLKGALSVIGLSLLGSITILDACRSSDSVNHQTQTKQDETGTLTDPVIDANQTATTTASPPDSQTIAPNDVSPETAGIVIDGLVSNSSTISYEALTQLPSITRSLTLVCPGVYEKTREWTGVPLSTILSQAGVQPGATQVAVCAGSYRTPLSLQDIQSGEIFLAYKVDGERLQEGDGYPLRLVLPGVVGNLWVRWVDHLELS